MDLVGFHVKYGQSYVIFEGPGGVPTVEQWVKNLTSIHGNVGSIPGLTHRLRICELW